ncbi:MAG: signal recognition particle-docking protein FtsY [Candidatus Bathyarchaeota archaeon]|nr:signal recognition particle-docking protein FtsY [Candidatus Bathyarchaeota archaeon]
MQSWADLWRAGELLEAIRRALDRFRSVILETELKPEDIHGYLEELKYSLIEADVAFEVAESLCSLIEDRVIGVKIARLSDRRSLVESALKTSILDILRSVEPEKSFEDIIRESSKPCIALFLGVNGVGKTLTIAKLGWRLKRSGFKVVLACSDTFRAGAIEQLEILSKMVGVDLVKQVYGGDPAAVAYDAVQYAKVRGLDIVLIDTAGRMQTKRNLLDEMRKIVRVVNPDVRIFVGDALTGNDIVDQAVEFNKYVGIDGAIVTKMDADVKGGAILNIAYTLRKPIFFIGVGSGIDDLIEYDPVYVASMLGF